MDTNSEEIALPFVAAFLMGAACLALAIEKMAHDGGVAHDGE